MRFVRGVEASSSSSPCRTPEATGPPPGPSSSPSSSSSTTSAAHTRSSSGSRGSIVNNNPQSSRGREETSGVVSKSISLERFEKVLFGSNVIDLECLRKILWLGVPEGASPKIRGIAWQTVLGYSPVQRDRCAHVLQKKRKEYFEFAREYCEDSKRTVLESEQRELRQILVDLPRTHAQLPIFTHPRVRKLLERVLYVWTMRYPASGYVQGLNEVLTVFVIVFLEARIGEQCSLDKVNIDEVHRDVLDDVEADSFWCLSKVLCHIQDNYTTGQPGIQRLVMRLKEIVKRIDKPLHQHLSDCGIDFLHLSFRWMNCLLVREFPMPCVARLWDTYIAEGDEGLPIFHVYVCAVFLVYWSQQMRSMDFQQLMLFIQRLPTDQWTNQRMETLLAEAFVLKTLFQSSPKHLDG